MLKNMTEKEKVLQEATSRITENLSAYSFLLQSKGKSIVKYSADKDVKLEIFFQVNRLSRAIDLEVFPHIEISSKYLKNWQQSEKLPNPTGVIFHSFLGYISPRKPKYNWVITGLSQINAVNEITEIIIRYALPIFDLFDNPNSAIEFLAVNGQFNKYTDYTLMPLDFMICFAPKEQAEQFFNHCPHKGKNIALYQELENCSEINLSYCEFYEANKVRLAYKYGLKNNK